MEHSDPEQESFDTAQVAMALLAILHLRHRFDTTASNVERTVLLAAAAEVLDRTVPSASLKEKLKGANAEQALQLLTKFRNDIALVPVGLWHKPRVTPNDLGHAHYAAWRALERLQRATRSNSFPEDRARSAQTVLDWLAETGARYPDLLAEAQHFRQSARPAAT